MHFCNHFRAGGTNIGCQRMSRSSMYRWSAKPPFSGKACRGSSRLIQGLPRLLLLRPSGFSNGIPQIPYLGSRHRSEPLYFFFCQGAQHLSLFGVPRCLAFHRLVQVLVLINTWLPVLVVRLLEKWPGRRRASPRPRALAPSCVSHIRGVDESAPCTFFICSQCQLIRAFPNNSCGEIRRELWLCHFLERRLFLQISHLYCQRQDKTTTPQEAGHLSHVPRLQKVPIAFWRVNISQSETALCSAVLAQSGTGAMVPLVPWPVPGHQRLDIPCVARRSGDIVAGSVPQEPFQQIAHCLCLKYRAYLVAIPSFSAL